MQQSVKKWTESTEKVVNSSYQIKKYFWQFLHQNIQEFNICPKRMNSIAKKYKNYITAEVCFIGWPLHTKLENISITPHLVSQTNYFERCENSLWVVVSLITGTYVNWKWIDKYYQSLKVLNAFNPNII